MGGSEGALITPPPPASSPAPAMELQRVWDMPGAFPESEVDVSAALFPDADTKKGEEEEEEEGVVVIVMPVHSKLRTADGSSDLGLEPWSLMSEEEEFEDLPLPPDTPLLLETEENGNPDSEEGITTALVQTAELELLPRSSSLDGNPLDFGGWASNSHASPSTIQTPTSDDAAESFRTDTFFKSETSDPPMTVHQQSNTILSTNTPVEALEHQAPMSQTSLIPTAIISEEQRAYLSEVATAPDETELVFLAIEYPPPTEEEEHIKKHSYLRHPPRLRDYVNGYPGPSTTPGKILPNQHTDSPYLPHLNPSPSTTPHQPSSSADSYRTLSPVPSLYPNTPYPKTPWQDRPTLPSSPNLANVSVPTGASLISRAQELYTSLLETDSPKSWWTYFYRRVTPLYIPASRTEPAASSSAAAANANPSEISLPSQCPGQESWSVEVEPGDEDSIPSTPLTEEYLKMYQRRIKYDRWKCRVRRFWKTLWRWVATVFEMVGVGILWFVSCCGVCG